METLQMNQQFSSKSIFKSNNRFFADNLLTIMEMVKDEVETEKINNEIYKTLTKFKKTQFIERKLCSVFLKLFYSIAPFSLLTRRFRLPSLIKQIQGSKFK